MCGVFGIIGGGESSGLGAMERAMRHRGPDDSGSVIEGHAALGMVRLSVIDIEGGRQPMSAGGRYTMVFNGEIYNFRELRAALEQQGVSFKTHSDSEVLLQLYAAKGKDCLDDLNGDFVFAVWDAQEQSLFIARDRLGVKPLYYWHDGTRFAFSSELKALLTLSEIPKTLNAQALSQYLSLLYIPAPLTIFESVAKLPAAHYLLFKKGKLSVQRYWDLPQVSQALEKDLPEKIRAALEEAVRLRLVSDVPLGAFLSGGLDSASIVHYMHAHRTGRVRTFSIGFEGQDATFDELDDARTAAQSYATEHSEFVVSPDIMRLLPQIVWHMDEPFADSSALVTYLISREARRHVTVALSGIGGDEVFGGYPRYLGARLSLAYERLPVWLRSRLAGLADALTESSTAQNTKGRLRRFLKAGLLPPQQRYLQWVSFFSREDQLQLFNGAYPRLSGVGSTRRTGPRTTPLRRHRPRRRSDVRDGRRPDRKAEHRARQEQSRGVAPGQRTLHRATSPVHSEGTGVHLR